MMTQNEIPDMQKVATNVFFDRKMSSKRIKRPDK